MHFTYLQLTSTLDWLKKRLDAKTSFLLAFVVSKFSTKRSFPNFLPFFSCLLILNAKVNS